MRNGEVTECVILGDVFVSFGAADKEPATFRDCLVSRGVRCLTAARIRSCVVGRVSPEGGDLEVLDCIVGRFCAAGERCRVENCAIIQDAPPHHSKNCFQATPQFRDPAHLDYSFKEKGPCRGKASDGGDIGCHYTPEMFEMCKIARELGVREIIKF